MKAMIGLLVGVVAALGSVACDRNCPSTSTEGTQSQVPPSTPQIEVSRVKRNELPMSVFKATMPLTKTKFVVYAQLSSYYNYEFNPYTHPSVRDQYYSVALTDADSDTDIYGYISKADAAKMFSLLKDGQSHLMQVELQYLPSKENSDITLMTSALPL